MLPTPEPSKRVTKGRRLVLPLLGLLVVPESAPCQAALYPPPGLLATPVASAECDGPYWYVAQGTSNGDGTPAAPFNNIQSALDAAAAGDTVLVAPGTYSLSTRLRTRRHGSSGACICLQSQDPASRPVITRAAGYTGSLLSVGHTYHVVDDFVFDGACATGSSGPLVNLFHCDSASSTDNGDYAVVRNSELRRNQNNGIIVSADHVLVENTSIHHLLRGSMAEPIDAHGILGTHQTDLTVRHVDIHHVSGDCLQTDPDLSNASGAAFNIKYQVDWTIDGVTLHDNEIGVRVRGPWDNAVQGGASLRLDNAVVYRNDIALRFERDVENVRIHHGTFHDNPVVAAHSDCPESPCYDTASFGR